jgi:hypothetical protein
MANDDWGPFIFPDDHLDASLQMIELVTGASNVPINPRQIGPVAYPRQPLSHRRH